MRPTPFDHFARSLLTPIEVCVCAHFDLNHSASPHNYSASGGNFRRASAASLRRGVRRWSIRHGTLGA